MTAAVHRQPVKAWPNNPHRKNGGEGRRNSRQENARTHIKLILVAHAAATRRDADADLIAVNDRYVEFADLNAVQLLAQFQPVCPARIPVPAELAWFDQSAGTAVPTAFASSWRNSVFSTLP